MYIKLIKPLLFFFLVFSCLENANAQLIPVKEKNKFGFIDSTGKMIIPAKFHAAQPFSDGLAAVRENGYYGYINTKGVYIIPPQYDYAEPFSEGIARVYKNGTSEFIDKSKNIKFKVPAGIAETKPFKDHLSVVKGMNGFSGLMNDQGELMVDTLYYSLEEIGDQWYIACLFDPSKGDTTLVHSYWRGSDTLNHPPDYGLINSAGEILIPFGKYVNIVKSGSIFACRGCKSIKHYFMDIYNSDLQLIYSYEDDLPYFSEFSFETGDYIVSRSNYEYGKGMSYSHDVLLNKKGGIILAKPEFEEIRAIPFTDKIFVRLKGEYTFCRLANLKGEFLDDIRYTTFLDDETPDNPLLVFYDIDGTKSIYIKDCWCILDTNLGLTTLDEFCGRGWGFEIQYKKNMYILSDDSEEGGRRYGWSKTLKGMGSIPFPLLTEPVIWEVGATLLSAPTDTSETVYRSDGRLIYSSKDLYKKYRYNMDKKVLMRFQVHGWDEWFGNGGTDWLPRPQKDEFNTVDFITVTSELNNNRYYHYNYDFDKHLERKIIVSNKNKEDTLALTTVGKYSELVLVIEAFNIENGTWMPVTTVDDQKSTEVRRLLPGDCWQLYIPEMEGGMKTSLRVKVEVMNMTTGKPEYLYSKPYAGSVNPAQFWRKDPSNKFWACPDYKFRGFYEW